MPAAVQSAIERRLLSLAGAVGCAVAVAAGAYASHGAEGQDQARLALAALMLFGHGLALQALAPRRIDALSGWSLRIMLLGMLLFSGSLFVAVVFAVATPLAPVGGSLLIVSWLLLAAAASRARI